jgi:hypothetical protein
MPRALFNMGSSAGAWYPAGVASGIYRNYLVATLAAGWLARAVNAAYANADRSRSPSKEGALRGLNFVKGVALGVRQGTPEAELAAREAALAVQGAFDDAYTKTQIKAMTVSGGPVTPVAAVTGVFPMQNGQPVNTPGNKSTVTTVHQENYFNGITDTKEIGKEVRTGLYRALDRATTGRLEN